ncbi:NAD-dependent deacylase [Alicyclobacillus sp. SO9]|nr:NAD-dependent deacylase [Alicyclobacillus sp. SO9]
MDHGRDLNRWSRVCFGDGGALGELSLLMKKSQSTVILTGAGMSTESDIPDFRSKDGWWRNIDPTTVATVDALKENYSLFHEFYQMRIENLESRVPSGGHYILAKWEEQGLIDCVATQNVDGFHQAAGSKEVYELHGSIRTIRCHDCQSPASIDEFVAGDRCSQCGGKLRPNLVLFGELLPRDAWERALAAIRQADLVVVIGSSLQVSPVNTLPSLTSGKVAIINAEETEQDEMFDIVIHGKAGEVLPKLDEVLG